MTSDMSDRCRWGPARPFDSGFGMALSHVRNAATILDGSCLSRYAFETTDIGQ